MTQQENRFNKRWTEAEDQRLARQVKAFPQNLHKCFMIVAEELDRTEGAVANHWYTVVSKKPENMCFFTASPRHVSKNRKNGMGEEIGTSIWRRLMNIIRNL
jgi:hypothetical protein